MNDEQRKQLLDDEPVRAVPVSKLEPADLGPGKGLGVLFAAVAKGIGRRQGPKVDGARLAFNELQTRLFGREYAWDNRLLEEEG